MHFIEPVTFGFFLIFQRADCPQARWPELGPGWCYLLLWTVRSVNACFALFLSEAHLVVADVLSEGPEHSAHTWIFQKASPI
jgi:hypothetical protein